MITVISSHYGYVYGTECVCVATLERMLWADAEIMTAMAAWEHYIISNLIV